MCHWFRVAVLPLDGELAAALLCRGSRKRCVPLQGRQPVRNQPGKYCPDCAGRMKKIKAAERKRKQRQMSHFRAFQTRTKSRLFSWESKGTRYIYPFPPEKRRLMRDNTPKSARTQGGDPIADYIRADTRLPAYLPYRFLLKMEISQTAKAAFAAVRPFHPLPRKTSGWTTRAGFILSIPSRR